MQKTLNTICLTIMLTLFAVSIVARIKGIDKDFSNGIGYVGSEFFLLSFGIDSIYSPNKVSKAKRNFFIALSVFTLILGVYILPDLLGASLAFTGSILGILEAFPGLLYKEIPQPRRTAR